MKDKNNRRQSGSQIFIEVKGGEPPKIVSRPIDTNGYPANLVKLNGVVLDKAPLAEWSEDDSWTVASNVASMCRDNADLDLPKHNALCEHLAYAYSILCDYLRETEGDWLMSKETSETLIRGAVDRIVRAGKCVDFSLDQYRSED